MDPARSAGTESTMARLDIAGTVVCFEADARTGARTAKTGVAQTAAMM